MVRDYSLERVSIASLRFDNARKDFGSEEDLLHLGESLKKKQHVPIFCQRDGLVYDGERRARAALMVGLPDLLAVVSETPLLAIERMEIQLETALFRADLTGFEKFEAVTAIKAAHPDWSNQQLAQHLKLDPKMAKVLTSPGRCIAEVVECLRLGQIGISVCYEISLLPEAEQLPLLQKKLAGASRDELAREGRRKRSGIASSVRVSRCKFARPSGNIVSISGEFTLIEAADELAELASDMRKAEKHGHDAKSFMAACRKGAKAAIG